jgi:hypothetical protein
MFLAACNIIISTENRHLHTIYDTSRSEANKWRYNESSHNSKKRRLLDLVNDLPSPVES